MSRGWWIAGGGAVVAAGVILFALVSSGETRKPQTRPSRPRQATPIVAEAPVVLPVEAPKIAPTVPKAAKTEVIPDTISESDPELVAADPISELAADLREQLEITDEVAAKVAQLLADRDEEAEKILAPCGDELSREEILETQPSLRHLDGKTDLSILALLTPAQQDAYRRLRDEGFIAGTMLDLPPTVAAEDFPDPPIDEP